MKFLYCHKNPFFRNIMSQSKLKCLSKIVIEPKKTKIDEIGFRVPIRGGEIEPSVLREAGPSRDNGAAVQRGGGVSALRGRGAAVLRGGGASDGRGRGAAVQRGGGDVQERGAIIGLKISKILGKVFCTSTYYSFLMLPKSK